MISFVDYKNILKLMLVMIVVHCEYTKNIVSYTLNGWIIWYVNYMGKKEVEVSGGQQKGWAGSNRRKGVMEEEWRKKNKKEGKEGAKHNICPWLVSETWLVNSFLYR